MVTIEEQFEFNRSLAINITYLYAKDRDSKNSVKWAEEAYKSSHGSISAYNLALSRWRQGNYDSYEKLMEESLELDPSNYSAMQVYGYYLMDKNDTRGREYIDSAYEILNYLLENEDLDEDDCYRLGKVAETLGKQDTLKSLHLYREKLGADDTIVKEEFLISSKNTDIMKKD